MRFDLRIWVFLVAMLMLSVLSAPLYAQIDAAALARAQRQGQNIGLGGTNRYDTSDGEEQNEEKDSNKVR